MVMSLSAFSTFGKRICTAQKATTRLNNLSNRACSVRTRSYRPLTTMANLVYPKPIVFNPTSEHKGTVIMLHGLGDTGEGWADIGAMFQSDLKHVKFIFPTAPKRPVTLNFGMVMTGWYDINSLEAVNHKEDDAGLKESARYVEELVSQEVKAGIPSEKVVVAGFSQGGAVALLMLRSNVKLGGAVGLSTYMPLSKEDPIVSEANKNTPILMCHGDSDQVIAYSYGRATAEKLVALGADVDFIPFQGMGHSACPTELEEIRKFLKKCLPA